MATGLKHPFELEAVDSKSVLKCYRLSASVYAFKVVTPQLGYEAIFIRLSDEVLEPDMVLTINHQNMTHKIPWLSPPLQNRTYARLNTLLASYTDTTTTVSTAATTQLITSQQLKPTVSASPSAQNRSVHPGLTERLQATLKPWPEPTGYDEAITHVLGWLWGVGTLLGLEGKSEESKAMEEMIREVEQKFKIER